MKATIYRRYGAPQRVLTLADVDAPRPGDDQVRVRIQAVGVTPYDWRVARGRPLLARLRWGWVRPRNPLPGVDYAGIVDQVGGGVDDLTPGDTVMGIHFGSYAEMTVPNRDWLVPKPKTLSFEEAAACPSSAITALQCLRDFGRVTPGSRVLINGASGGLGTFSIQIAKWLGAHVTAICSGRNADMVRSLGADHVVDYTIEDVTMLTTRFDTILDAVGNHPVTRFRRLLTGGGILVATAGPVGRLLWIKMRNRNDVVTMIGKPNGPDLALLAGLLESRTIRPVIDRIVPLAGTPEAVAYLETGRARGKVVVSLNA